MNGALFTGATGAAGEIGHTTLAINGKPCSCGRLGCAESYIGLRVVAAAVGCLNDGVIDRTKLNERIQSGHTATKAAFARAGDYLGVLLQNVWTTFNPMAIVLGGETIALGGEIMLASVNRVVADVAQRVGIAPPIIRVARYAEWAAAVGGAAYVLHAILNPYQPALHTQYANSERQIT